MGNSALGNNPERLQAIKAAPLVDGTTVPTTYFNSVGLTATQQGDYVTAPSSLRQIMSSGNASREVIKSRAVVLQSYWLSDLLVTTAGWRRDEDYLDRRNLTFAQNPTKVTYGLNDFTFPSTPPRQASKEIKSYGAVLFWPRKLVRLPAGTDLSFFVNDSQNFTPSGVRVNPYNEQIAPPQGKTREYGAGLSFFNDKLTLRYSHFETSVVGQTYSNSAYGVAVNNGTAQLTQFWISDGNTNPQNVDFVAADIEKLYSTLPANFRDLIQLRITGSVDARNRSTSAAALPGLSDTTDFVAKGHELEFVFNPSRQWRLLANVAQAETVQSNIAPNFKEFVARMRPVWTALGNRPFSGYPANWVPGVSTLPATTLTVAQWADSNVYVPLATVTASEGIASAEQRKYRVNLVANYTFSRSSRLAGWSTGAGFRWQSKIGIGYPIARNPDLSVTTDIKHPYYAPGETNVDAWVAYTRKLWRNRIEWKVQLNAKNLFGGGDPIAVTVQPWGDVAATRLPPERRWYLNNTFSF